MNAPHGVVVHVTSDEASDWQMALRNLANLVRDDAVEVRPEQIQLVVNGPAVRFLLASSPDAANVEQMAEAGVSVKVCGNSLERFDHDQEDLAAGVSVIGSGVAEVLRAQQHGAHFLKLP
jgi:intracellular sulfur oxidation DsrE/DsrF family protein